MMCLYLHRLIRYFLKCFLGELADLIFVFFDPIGQALCKRTLNLVEQLNIRHPERLRFYLSKADEAGTESDRQRFLFRLHYSFFHFFLLSTSGALTKLVFF